MKRGALLQACYGAEGIALKVAFTTGEGDADCMHKAFQLVHLLLRCVPRSRATQVHAHAHANTHACAPTCACGRHANAMRGAGAPSGGR